MLRIVLAALLLCLGVCAETRELTPRIPVPESAFLSRAEYTNAFFGFRLTLPQKHFEVIDLSDSNKALRHFLFAEKSLDHGITLLILSATQVLGNPDEEAQKMAFMPSEQGAKPPEALDIGGRLFWKNQTEQKSFSGKAYRLRYATGMRGYVLVVSVSAQNARQADELRQNIESIKFFDPKSAKEMAGADSRPYLTEAVQHRLQNAPQLDVAKLDPGHLSGNVYSNSFLGFSYHFPEGWQVGRDPAQLTLTSPQSHSQQTDAKDSWTEQCTRVLSFATEQSPSQDLDHFNPRILILAADPACFAPDLKFPESIHDNQDIQLFGEMIVRSFAGTPFLGHNASRLLAADLDGHLFLEMPSLGAVPVSGSTLLRKVHMSFVLTSLKQYWVIWLMESDTESQLSRLMKTSISFVPANPIR